MLFIFTVEITRSVAIIKFIEVFIGTREEVSEVSKAVVAVAVEEVVSEDIETVGSILVNAVVSNVSVEDPVNAEFGVVISDVDSIVECSGIFGVELIWAIDFVNSGSMSEIEKQ